MRNISLKCIVEGMGIKLINFVMILKDLSLSVNKGFM